MSGDEAGTMTTTVAVQAAGGPQPEHIAVQLARMEGTLNLAAFQITAVSQRLDKHDTRLERHDGEIAGLHSITQTLADQAAAREQLATAQQAAVDRRDKEAWSPWAKLFTVLGGIALVWGFVSPYLP